jgi:hypothetical protein
MPRVRPVESRVRRYPLEDLKSLSDAGLVAWSLTFCCDRAVNVNLHGTRPWHPELSSASGSNKREPPRGKPVASGTKFRLW